MIEVEVDEGILSWDGRVLELFRGDGRTGAFRVHARTVEHWELEPRRGLTLVKVYTTAKHYESVLVPTPDVGAVEAMLRELDAVRG